VTREILDSEGASMRVDEDFFSVARTTPFVAGDDDGLAEAIDKVITEAIPLIPSAVTPWLTAFKAYSVLIRHNKHHDRVKYKYQFEPAFHCDDH
jgi:hypothetical protein